MAGVPSKSTIRLGFLLDTGEQGASVVFDLFVDALGLFVVGKRQYTL